MTSRHDYYQMWYEANRKEHLAKCSVPVKCECGRYVIKSSMIRHLQSKSHRRALKEINNPKRYDEDKDRIRCDCGQLIKPSSIKSHLKSQYHKKYSEE